MGVFPVSPRRKLLLRVVWAFLLTFVVACSLLPGDSQAKQVMDTYFNDKLGHAAAYFLLAFFPLSSCGGDFLRLLRQLLVR